MAKVGAPTDYNQDIANKICKYLSAGMLLKEVCAMDGFPERTTVWDWRRRHPEFANLYAQALEDQQQCFADEIRFRARDESRDYYTDSKGERRSDNTAVQRDKLIIDTDKWLMARLASKMYGDKITTEHTGSIEFSQTVDRPQLETPEQWQERVSREIAERKTLVR